MHFKNPFFLFFCCLFLAFLHSTDAFNITQLLNQYPDFTTFNNYLTQTGVAATVNTRQTLTVLVVDNGNISPLSSVPKDVLMDIMSVHVLLDYYDLKKLQSLPNKTAAITSLFQSSGRAINQQGFVNVTDSSSGSVSVGSAAQGSTPMASVVKSIYAQPYNISVLQISSIIVPKGIDSASNSSSKTPAQAPAPAPAPKPKGKAPAPAPAPKPKSNTPAPSPSRVKPAPSKAPAKSPSKHSPAVSPAAVPSGAPVPSSPSDAPTADAPGPHAPAADTPSAGTSLRLNLEGMVAAVSVAVWLLAAMI